jgi:hypothetical protein
METVNSTQRTSTSASHLRRNLLHPLFIKERTYRRTSKGAGEGERGRDRT